MGIKRIEIRYEEIRARAGMASISEKIREATLRLLGHVEIKTEEYEVGGHRKILRRKLRWSNVIRKYMKEKQVKIEEAQDRRK